MFRKALCNQRNARTATHSDHRGDVRPANPVALQCISQRRQDTVERCGDQRLQLRSRHPDRRPVTRQLGGDLRLGIDGQPLLGTTAFLSQPGERTHRGGAGRIDTARRRDAVDDVAEERLVDLIAGELRETSALIDRLEGGTGVRQRDARPATTEIQQRNHALGRQPEIGMKRRE